MSRSFPTTTTGVLKIPPVVSVVPDGGDLMGVHLRYWGFANNTNGRFITRRDVAPSTWGIHSNTGPTHSFQAAFSGLGVWNWPCAALNRWHDLLVVFDYSSAASTPVVYVDGAPVVVTRQGSQPTGSPTVNSTADTFVGNRSAGNGPLDGAIAEVAFWKGRLLGAADAQMIAAYGPESVSRNRTGLWQLDKFGGPVIPNRDSRGSASHIVAGAQLTGMHNFTNAPPRKVRYYRIPFISVPAPSGGATGAGDLVGIGVATATAMVIGAGAAVGIGAATGAAQEVGAAASVGVATASASAQAVAAAASVGIASASATGQDVGSAAAGGVAAATATATEIAAGVAIGVSTATAAAREIGAGAAVGVATATAIASGSNAGAATGVAVATAAAQEIGQGAAVGGAIATAAARLFGGGASVGIATSTSAARVVGAGSAVGAGAATAVAQVITTERAALRGRVTVGSQLRGRTAITPALAGSISVRPRLSGVVTILPG